MYIFPKMITLRKSLLFYRGIRYRKGFGVHSPFVFNLISKVIENKYSFYSFYDIELIRRELIYNEGKIEIPDRRHKGIIREMSIGKAVEMYGIRPKKGALLFRLANYFKSKNIIQIGSAMGLSTLYLTSYSRHVHCTVLEHDAAFGRITELALKKGERNPVELKMGDYHHTLPKALSTMKNVDMVFFNTASKPEENEYLFEECLKYINEDTVFVFDGIKNSKSMRAFWKKVCGAEDVTVSMDLYSIGVLFFNKKLYKRNYIVYF